MNRLILNNNEEEKKIITFTVNKRLKQELREILATSDKYNLKKKSDWVNEAIEMLRKDPGYVELVCHAEGNNEDFVFDKIYMTFKQRCFFAEMRSEVVRMYPDIKGPQGAIIRAALMSRITRKT